MTHDDLVAAVAAEARAHADAWFPELDARRVGVRFVSTAARPRCFLHRVELDDGQVQRTVAVKVRHSQPGLRRLDKFEGRPVLNPERTLSDEETAKREYDGLRTIADAVSSAGDERFGVLRALAWLPQQSAMVMDFVEEPTLRALLLRTARTRPRRTSPMSEAPWLNAGAWLRTFHDHETPLTLAMGSRLGTSTQVGEMYRAFTSFLLDVIGSVPLLRRLDDMAVDLAAAAFPEELPVVPGHGDFVANNVFTGQAGTVTGFDPLTLWRVPRYQDLATLSVGIRILPLQAATQGLALPREQLDRYERALLHGYFAPGEVPLAGVRAYQLLVLLDRWSDLVSKQVHGGAARRRLRDLRVRTATSHCHREAGRLLSQLAD